MWPVLVGRSVASMWLVEFCDRLAGGTYKARGWAVAGMLVVRGLVCWPSIGRHTPACVVVHCFFAICRWSLHWSAFCIHSLLLPTKLDDDKLVGLLCAI